MEPVKPVDGSSVGTVNLGLIEQFHYVALIHNEPDPEANATEIAQDEAAFEHACKVKGAPFETCLVPENPELEGKIFSVAPGEGQKPPPILTDPKFEETCNNILLEKEVILQKTTSHNSSQILQPKDS